MMKGISIFRRDGVLPVTIAVVVSVLFVVGSTSGATTISTDITTGGNVYATGTLQATGAVTAYGDTTLGGTVADSVTANAYFTQLRIGTGSTFGNIGTVGADELGVEGAVEIDGAAYLDGAVYASSTLQATSAVTTYGGIVNTSTGTSSLKLLSTSATKGFCIELNATSTNTLLNLTATTTTSGDGGASGLLLQYGACS